MSKTSKVTKLDAWDNAQPDQYGNIPYNIEFEDGTKGAYRGNPSKLSFTVGEDAEYEASEVTSKNGKTYTKISKPKKDNFGGGGGYKPDTVGITVGACLNLAVSMFNNGKFDDISKIETTADWLVEMSFRLKDKHSNKA